MSRRRRFHLRRDGTVRVSLPADERDLLRSLLVQYRHLLDRGDDADPALRRLHPPARPDDPDAERDWRDLVDGQLRRHRLDAVDRVTATLDGADLDDDGVDAWLRTLTALRLVVGERIGAFDPPGTGAPEGAHDPTRGDDTGGAHPLAVVHDWLALLLELLVDEASGRLDESA